jgi:hypothetical protein
MAVLSHFGDHYPWLAAFTAGKILNQTAGFFKILIIPRF